MSEQSTNDKEIESAEKPLYNEKELREARGELIDLVNEKKLGDDVTVATIAKFTDKQIVDLIEKYTDPNISHTTLIDQLKSILVKKELDDNPLRKNVDNLVDDVTDETDITKPNPIPPTDPSEVIGDNTAPDGSPLPASISNDGNPEADSKLEQTVADGHVPEETLKNRIEDVKFKLNAIVYGKVGSLFEKFKNMPEGKKRTLAMGGAALFGTYMGVRYAGLFAGGGNGQALAAATEQTGASGATGELTNGTGGVEYEPKPSLPIFGELDTNKTGEKSSTNEFASNYSDKNHSGDKVNAWGTERGIEDARFGTFKGETLEKYLDTHSRITAGNVEVLVNARFQEKYGLDADKFNSEWGVKERESMKREYLSDSGHSLSEAGQRAHKYHMQELSKGKVVKMTASEAASKHGLTVNSYMTEGNLKGGIDDIATAGGGVEGTVLVTLDEDGKPKFAEKAACGNNILIGNPEIVNPDTPNTTPETETPTPDEDIDVIHDMDYNPREWPEPDHKKKAWEAPQGHDNGDNPAPKGDQTTDQDIAGNIPGGNQTNPTPTGTARPEPTTSPTEPTSQPGTGPTEPAH